ncbi:hypothetical protein, partial [uncultured Ruminococcus sp.]|uniref:hypothetical protein n=1 Tax=uncultured Ruminococcus sp. TaxID=165186 RepID=UPI0025EC905D
VIIRFDNHTNYPIAPVGDDVLGVPYNPEITANPEHGRTLFAPTTFQASSTAAKSLRSMLVHNSGQLCPFLTPHLNSTLTSPP